MKPYLRTTDSHVGQIECVQPLRLPLSHRFTFTTSSLSETSSFWEEVVGLPLVLDQGTCRIYRISPDGYLGFCEKEGMSTAKDGMIITLVTEKVDEVIAKLGARGLVLEKEPVFNPTFNIYHAFFRDPNGLLVEVQRFEDPQWPKSHSRLSR